MDNPKKLFDQFPPVTDQEWKDRIVADLKGADFNEKLVWKSDMGFDVNPYYRAGDIESIPYINSLPGEFPWVRGRDKGGNGWKVRQNIEVSDYSAANEKALSILMRGVDSLGFIITSPESISEQNFSLLLDNIHAEAVELNFISNGKALEIVEILKSVAKKRGFDNSAFNGAIEADPLGRLMLNGKLCVGLDEAFDYLARLMRETADLPNLRVLQVNASSFCNAGADIATQLAYALSMANEYLSQMTSRGIDADLALSKTRFCFGVGSEYFAEISRLRAARMLWALVAGAYKPVVEKNREMNIHCVTSEWNKTTFDPYVNMLRTQTEAMSAILGGTDSLTVAPFDETFRRPGDFSERIARNQQLILREESYFDKVADPGAGSYYIENLTKLIAEASWKLFVETEEQGGFLPALKQGFIQKRLAEAAEKRRDDVASGKIKLLGTNLYPNMKESVPTDLDTIRMFREKPDSQDNVVEPVILSRGAEDIERERLFGKKEGDNGL